jgi:hypothetical protein
MYMKTKMPHELQLRKRYGFYEPGI